MKIGFIGLGNLGGKLSESLLKNGFALTVCDLKRSKAKLLMRAGASWESSPRILAESSDLLITCLPSPEISARVLEQKEGVLEGLSKGKIWAEMSTTDHDEVRRLGGLAAEKGAQVIDCPVSGGCHRAKTGNISIFVGGERQTFSRAFPVLQAMGRRILHVGPLGSASMLKLISNYLATANLAALSEAFITAKKAGIDLKTAYAGIRISSGNSFVHETESQVILNGSRNINFTMGLVLKDIRLFRDLAERNGVRLELLPKLIEIFEDGQSRFGSEAWSSDIIRRLENDLGIDILADGFPPEIIDTEPEAKGYEITTKTDIY